MRCLDRRPPPTALLAVALTGSLATGAAAQERPAGPPFREVTEVNVVNVEVVVTDRQGRPVTGLGPDDFELFENGEPVAISNFFAVEAGRPAPPPAAAGSTEPVPAPPSEPRVRQNHLIVYVDNANIRETNRRKLFKRLERFLRASWRGNLWAMVVSNDRSLTIRQEFTSELEVMLAAIDRLERTTTIEARFAAERRTLMRLIEDVNVEAGSGVFGVSSSVGQAALSDLVQGQARALLPQIRAYSQQRLQHTRDTLRILDQLVSMAAGMPGRKAVLYVSDGLSLRPGEALYEGFSRRFQLLGTVGDEVSPAFEAAREDATTDFRRLVSHANTSGVTFYTVDASPAAPLLRGAAESTAGAGGNFGSWKDAIESTEQANRQDSLVMMADGTGGRYGFTPSGFDELFNGILDDFDNFYSLGYVADRLESGKRREIEVELRGDPPGLVVRHRSSFRDKTALEVAAERAQAALLVGDLDNPLGVAVEPHDRQRREDGNWLVRLLVKLELDKLALLPEAEVARGNVSVFVAVRDEAGRTSGVQRIFCPIQIPAADVAAGADGTAACGVSLLMRQGRQRVAVSVLDETALAHSTTSLMLDVGAAGRAAAGP